MCILKDTLIGLQKSQRKRKGRQDMLTTQREFNTALRFTLLWEGGWVDDPDDYPTNHGIRQSTYDAYRRRKSHSLQSVKNMKRWEMEEIYLLDYWQPAWCGRLPWPVSLVVWDMAVHSGVHAARKNLQKALRVMPDGMFGPKTQDAITTQLKMPAGRQKTAKKCLRARRMLFFRIAVRHPSKAKFLRGWLRRLSALKDFTLSKPRLLNNFPSTHVSAYGP